MDYAGYDSLFSCMSAISKYTRGEGNNKMTVTGSYYCK